MHTHTAYTHIIINTHIYTRTHTHTQHTHTHCHSYNNEWMVVDYKLFQEGGKELSDNLLWVLEQIP